jgi:hypothetical protein
MDITAYLTNAGVGGGASDEMNGGESSARGVTYVQPHDRPAAKDSVIGALMPDTVSECALYLGKKEGEPCASDSTISRIGKTLGLTGAAGEIITRAFAATGCESERCVLSKLTPQLGAGLVKEEINTHFKVTGPTDSRLLNNINLDATLLQWATLYTDFYPYNFNMRNYASYSFEGGHIIHRPDTLATINFDDLYSGLATGRKYRCCGCIINTDTYQGEGKHWMALFADARSRGTWTVEFFNSSGNPPAPEWINWLEKTRNIMEKIIDSERASGKSAAIVKVTSIRHQQSKSECGMYSLFYIWARLHGVKPEYFMTNHVPDQLMFEFRQHLFDDPSRKSVKRFHWDEYSSNVKIEWER